MYSRMYVLCICICMYVCMYVCTEWMLMYECMYVCMYVITWFWNSHMEVDSVNLCFRKVIGWLLKVRLGLDFGFI